MLGDHALFRGEAEYRLNELARHFGAEFARPGAVAPLKAEAELGSGAVETWGGRTLELADPSVWRILVRDREGRCVAARRAVGEGRLLVASRALFGRQPDASDPINAALWQPLLAELASGKRVDPKGPPRITMPENLTQEVGLRIQCSDYLQPSAEAIVDLYGRCRPRLEEMLGVPPHRGMLETLILLPTGGGGFSSGASIGLGVWWGGFPEEPCGMVELLGHEGTHSWVLPFAEPMWNEGLATYVGILLGREMGFAEQADAALAGWLARARELDPDMDRYDLAGSAEVPHAVRMAKPMWIWSQLTEERPDVLRRYFRAKRERIDPEERSEYTADDCVAVLSIAMGRDLFPWFRSLGTGVDLARTSVELR